MTIEIPRDVLADAEACPEAYQPDVQPGREVLSLVLGVVFRVRDHRQSYGLPVDEIADTSVLVGGYLRVGSLDGGPRPDVGQRVIVLTTTGAGGAPVGSVGQVIDRWDADEPVIVLADGSGLLAAATMWALLPALAHPDLTEQDAMRRQMRTARSAERRQDAVEALAAWLADVDDPYDADPEHTQRAEAILATVLAGDSAQQAVAAVPSDATPSQLLAAAQCYLSAARVAHEAPTLAADFRARAGDTDDPEYAAKLQASAEAYEHDPMTEWYGAGFSAHPPLWPWPGRAWLPTRTASANVAIATELAARAVRPQ